jgi:hypothetical protein
MLAVTLSEDYELYNVRNKGHKTQDRALLFNSLWIRKSSLWEHILTTDSDNKFTMTDINDCQQDSIEATAVMPNKWVIKVKM